MPSSARPREPRMPSPVGRWPEGPDEGMEHSTNCTAYCSCSPTLISRARKERAPGIPRGMMRGKSRLRRASFSSGEAFRPRPSAAVRDEEALQMRPAPCGYSSAHIFETVLFFLRRERKERFQSSRKRKRTVRNLKCSPCRHRVRRRLFRSASTGAAKAPHPQPPSSFPNCDRFTGSQFGFRGFRRAARDLDDGGQAASCGYGL